MNRSDVFENFVKIAKKEGLIEAEHAEHTEKDFSETNPRMDSLSIEQIGKLYNNKPSSPKEMEYKRNIMEIAHPESLVISPSYDKLNGLIENENEGQDIRIHISLKEPDGHLVYRKYAEKQLILSLVRVGNDLDNQNKTGLRALADVCLMQAAQKKIEKTAFYPALAFAMAAVGAAIYAQQHLNLSSKGFKTDYMTTVSAINNLLESNSNYGVGYSFTPEFIQIASQLKQKLSTLFLAVQQAMPIISQVERPRSLKELAVLSQTADAKNAIQAIEELKNTVEDVFPYIDQIISDFSNPSFKQRAIANEGQISSWIDSVPGLHGGAGFFSDKFDAVAQDLPTLKEDIENIIKDLQGAENAQQVYAERYQKSQTQTSHIFQHPNAPVKNTRPAPTEPASEPAEPAESMPGIENMIDYLRSQTK